MSHRADTALTPDAVASSLAECVSRLSRQLRQPLPEGELKLPERSALAKIARYGPTTAAALAKLEQISPQSMGATIAALESRGLVSRTDDPADGRRAVLSTTEAGRATLKARGEARNAAFTHALTSNFSASELEQLQAAVLLLERLARVV